MFVYWFPVVKTFKAVYGTVLPKLLICVAFKISIEKTCLQTFQPPKPPNLRSFKNFPEKPWDLGPNPWYLGNILKMKNPKGYHVTHEEYLTTHQGKVSLACPMILGQ